jgi:putative membrane protein
MSDPRVFFAAERTLLAWIRTGLTVMGFGFVVARFGLFLRLLAVQRAPAGGETELHTSFSSFVGIALVLIGAAAIFAAGYQYRKFSASIPTQDLPTSYNRAFPIVLAVLLGSLGLALAIYLAV